VAIVLSSLAAAAAACFYTRRKRRSQARSTGWKLPLLTEEERTGGSGVSGGGTDGQMGGYIGVGGAGGPAAAAPTQSDAEYDILTGAPVNTVAKKEVAQDWSTGVRTGESSCVVQLPYAELELVTANFSEFNVIGGGASCAVFTGRVFGVAVAIKVTNTSAR
jgi:hypothetical protein